MIYVIAPSWSDFLFVCRKKMIHPLDYKKIKWVHDRNSLAGMVIRKGDEIIKERLYLFPDHALEIIEMELEIRKHNAE